MRIHGSGGLRLQGTYFDKFCRTNLTPLLRGANVPALNDLLKHFGIAFGDRIYDGEFQLGTTTEDDKALVHFYFIQLFSPFPSTGYSPTHFESTRIYCKSTLIVCLGNRHFHLSKGRHAIFTELI